MTPFTTDSLTSRDGTTVGYRKLGHGPGVVVLHGALESAGSHMRLAEALAPTFTVYLPDRRGRGRSGAFPQDYAVRQDVEDMDALLRKTGARYVFGVSSGAVIWLHAALSLDAIHKAAIFEPPLLVNASAARSLVTRYDREIAEGNVAAALVTGMKAAQLAPPIFNLMPRWLIERLTQTMVDSGDKKQSADSVTVRTLAPTLHYDFALVFASEGPLERFGAIRAELLLLGGSKSPAFLKAALDGLEKACPRAKRIELSGLGHSAAGNPDDPMTGRGADPERVAQELRRFFA